jgi:hypothetical protein
VVTETCSAAHACRHPLRYRQRAIVLAAVKDKPFGWPRKARLSLTATRHDGAVKLRSGRKNGSAGVKQKNGRKAGFVPRFCHHDTRGPPSIFLAQKTGTIADFPIRYRGRAYKLKSALVHLQDSGFIAPHEATANRSTLVDQYVSAFRYVEAAALQEAQNTLHDLMANISARIVPDQQGALKELVESQLAKLG